MMKKYFAILLALLCFCICLTPCNTVFADGPDATIIFSSSSVDVGEDITVTLRFKNTTANISKVEGSLTYDASVIECDSEAGGGGNIHIVENAIPSVDSLDVTLTFKALKAGSSKLAIECTLFDENEVSIGTAAASATLTVTNPTVFLSNNANLASLTVSYGTLAPEFSPSITEYTVAVGNEVTKFPLSAKAEDANSTIAITGSQNLEVGMNQRVVTVTAQDGTQKVYTVTIVRAEPVQTATPEATDRPVSSNTPDRPTQTPSQTQIQWDPMTPTPDTTPEVTPSATVEVTPTPTQPPQSMVATTPDTGMTVNQLKNTVLIVIVVLAIIIIVILFTVVYCMQQKDQKKRGGKGGKKNTSRKRR